LWASLELRRRCSDRVTAMKRRRRRSSAAAALKLGGRGKRGGGGEERRGSPAFIGSRGQRGEAVARQQWSAFKRINTIDGRGFKDWFKRVNQGEGVKGSRRHLKVQSMVAGSSMKR
jgi:hypothetical protein